MSNSPLEIKDLDVLLSGKFSSTVRRYTSKPLVEPGENYGSLLYDVSVVLEDRTQLHLVAKMVPKNEWIRKQFNIPETFKREIVMYDVIASMLRDFQIEEIGEELLCLPKMFATRTSLNSKPGLIDDHAIILMENLKHSGFATFDRTIGCGFNSAQIAITNLAIFHAVPVALKIKRPEAFKKIRPYLSYLELFKAVSADVLQQMTDKVVRIAELSKECVSLVPNILKAFELCKLRKRNNWHLAEEPFATIAHNDFWLNNVMIKCVDDKPVCCKLIDFQLIDYGSPCYDVVFFLYTSLHEIVLENHFHDLISEYFKVFVRTLERFRCDTTPFSNQIFLEEIEEVSKSLFMGIALRLDLILSPNGADKAVEEMTEEHLVTDHASELYQKKLHKFILDFYQKGWI